MSIKEKILNWRELMKELENLSEFFVQEMGVCTH